METEEVAIKLGMHTAGLNQGSGEAKRAIHELKEEAEQFGIHAERRSRAFHKVLHEISAISPVAGVALRFAFDPIVGLFSAAVMGGELLHKSIEKIKKGLEEVVEHSAAWHESLEKGTDKALEKLNKYRESFRNWLEEMKEGKPGESAATHKRDVIGGIDEGDGSKTEKIQAKLKALAEIRSEDRSEEAQKMREAQFQADEVQRKGTAITIEQKKVEIEEIRKEEAKARREMLTAEQQAIMHPSASNQQKLVDAQNTLRMHQTVRSARQEELSAVESEEEKKRKELERTMKEAEAAHHAGIDDEKEMSQLKKELREEEKREKEKADKEAAAMAEKERLRVFEEVKLNRDLAFAKRRRQEEENSPFMPTLREIAGSGMWDVAGAMRAQMQRDNDNFKINAGMAYASKFSGQAQELERMEADAKSALFVEGPDSARFKADKQRIDSLKAGLAASGLQRPNDRLESIDKHIADLLDKASKDGLIVQPVNGP